MGSFLALLMPCQKMAVQYYVGKNPHNLWMNNKRKIPIRSGANKELKNIQGRTPLILAAEYGRVQAVQAFLETEGNSDTKEIRECSHSYYLKKMKKIIRNFYTNQLVTNLSKTKVQEIDDLKDPISLDFGCDTLLPSGHMISRVNLKKHLARKKLIHSRESILLALMFVQKLSMSY